MFAVSSFDAGLDYSSRSRMPTGQNSAEEASVFGLFSPGRVRCSHAQKDPLSGTCPQCDGGPGEDDPRDVANLHDLDPQESPRILTAGGEQEEGLPSAKDSIRIALIRPSPERALLVQRRDEDAGEDGADGALTLSKSCGDHPSGTEVAAIRPKGQRSPSSPAATRSPENAVPVKPRRSRSLACCEAMSNLLPLNNVDSFAKSVHFLQHQVDLVDPENDPLDEGALQENLSFMSDDKDGRRRHVTSVKAR